MAVRAVVFSMLGVVAVAVGCGGGGGSDPDGAPPDPDAAPAPWAIEIAIDGVVGDEVSVEAAVGEDAVVELVLTNTGTAPSPDLELALSGPAAADYAVAAPCEGQAIQPAASCTVALTFAPSAEGVRTATLEVGFGATVIPIALAGEGLGAALHVDVTGGLIEVAVIEGKSVLQVCAGSCTVDVAPGATVIVAATSIGEPVLITGACTGTRSCELTMPAAGSATVELTAPVDAATGEQWRVGFADPVLDAAFDTAGNVVVLVGGEVVKLDAAGVELWSVTRAATAVEVGPDDTIYVADGDALTRLTAAGAAMWTAVGAGGCAGALSKCLAVGPSGEAAIAFAGIVRRFLADGTPSWTRAMPGGTVTEQAVAIDAAGVVYGTSDAVDQLTLEPTSAAGVALPAMEAYCDEYRGGPVIDPATGAVWCVTSGHGDVVWRRALNSFVERPTSAAGSVSVGLTGTGTGDAGWAYENDEGPDNRWHLVRMTGTTVAWAHVFPVVSSFPSPLFPTYSKPTAITGAVTGRLAAAGSIEGFGALRGFVISFAP